MCSVLVFGYFRYDILTKVTKEEENVPINFTRPEHTKDHFDWNHIFSYLNSYKFFRNKSVQEKFLNAWKERIIKDEQSSYREMKTVDFEGTEHFPFKTMFGPIFLGWCALNVDEIERQIYKEQLSPSKLNLSEMISEEIYLMNKVITPTDKIVFYSEGASPVFSYIPVIVLSPTFFYFYDRVIDGNHRISYSLENGISELSSYFLTEHFFINHKNVFLDSFSHSIFLFWCDLHFFLNSYAERQKLKNRILQKSDYRHFLENSHISFF